MKRKNKKLEKGITLIALIITIIILLILAGVTITMITGDNGILKQATNARETNSKAEFEEQVKIAVMASRVNSSGNIDLDELDKELNKISNVSIKKSDENKLPWTVSKNGNSIVIDGDGNVTKTDTEKDNDQINQKAGLYDANDEQIANWNTLVNTYKLDVTKDYTYSSYKEDSGTNSMYYILNNNDSLSTGTKVIIDESIEKVGNYAFYKCSNLTEVEIPDSVTQVGEAAFGECPKISNIKISKNLVNIGDDAFSVTDDEKNDLMLESIDVDPENPKFESDNGILYTKGKKTLIQYPYNKEQDIFSLPEETETIGLGAMNKSKVKEVKLNNVTKLCKSSFVQTDNLTTISSNEKLEIIGEYSFSYSKLPSITIYENVKKLKSAFYECDLQSIEIKSNKIEDAICAFSNCSKLENIVLPSQLTEIYWGMFLNCKNLKSITIPDSVEKIDGFAFLGCSSTLELSLPNGLTTIGDHAFGSCIVRTIPTSVTTVGNDILSNKVYLEEESYNRINAINPKAFVTEGYGTAGGYTTPSHVYAEQ